MAETAADPLNIGFVLCTGMLFTGTALPLEMWQAAADYRRARRRTEPQCRFHLIAGEKDFGASVPALNPDCALSDSPSLDVIYLPALWRHPLATARRMTALGSWLEEQFQSGSRIAAVSTGVALLAASGLLDRRAATTHWYYLDEMRRAFPRVDFKREYFVTQSESLYCAASINSLADVTVHLIERLLERGAAQHAERNFSHEIRRTYTEYRYLEGGAATPLADEIVVEAQSWIAENLARSTTVSDLARHLGIGVRTLERRFRQATGISPRVFWQRQRLQLAKELLETTNLEIGDIAWRVGYQDAGFFSRLFQREMMVTPSAYRRTVRAKLFSA
ncbi:MAG: GlxA family transcriptional regulator [Gammaproteobacteria bacterium]|jgi:transcriptional regulator GlxA family with amidase domain